MRTIEVNFIVEGVDTEDGSRTTLGEFETSGEAVRFLQGYTRRLDDDGRVGGWSLIEVYDVRDPDNAERWSVWEAEDVD